MHNNEKIVSAQNKIKDKELQNFKRNSYRNGKDKIIKQEAFKYDFCSPDTYSGF